MSIPRGPMSTHGSGGNLRGILCFLFALVLLLGIMLSTHPEKQSPVRPETYALSGEDYSTFLSKDTHWFLDSRSPQKSIQLVRGDSGVQMNTIKWIGDVVQNESVDTVYTLTKMQFNTPVFLSIDSNKNAYAMELKAHFSASKLTNEVNQSLGIQFNNSIYLPVYKFDDSSTNGEIGNTLAHELTHAMLYQNGIEVKLPIWMNEGFAWYVGNQAQRKINPEDEAELEHEIQETIFYEARVRKLYHLSQNNTMFTKNEPEYNMEWEDYFAVKDLIQRYGLEKFQAFLFDLQKQNLDTDFQEKFGVPISTFEENFYQEEIEITK